MYFQGRPAGNQSKNAEWIVLAEELLEEQVAVVREDQGLLAAGNLVPGAAAAEAGLQVDQTYAVAVPRSTSAHSQSGCVSGGP